MRRLKQLAVIAVVAIPLATAGGAAGLIQGVAAAEGNGTGATTFTAHVHGATAYGQVVVTFLPTGTGPPLPTGCWLPASDAFMSTSGNGIFHGTANKTGFWFTTTYTGTADVLPIAFTPTTGLPLLQTPTTPTSGVVVTATAAPLATGHLTIWLGTEDNLKNGVTHATLTFKGAMATGQVVDMNGHFQIATNANGVLTVMNGSIACS